MERFHKRVILGTILVALGVVLHQPILTSVGEMLRGPQASIPGEFRPAE